MDTNVQNPLTKKSPKRMKCSLMQNRNFTTLLLIQNYNAMKTKLLLIFLLCFYTVSNAQTTLIPDADFEQALIDLGYDVAPLDGQVPTININTITHLNVSSKGIADLTGIEDFTALTNLMCHSNLLTSINLSQNTSLTHLFVYSNQLTTLDVTNNINLTNLYCEVNMIGSLDISQNTALTHMRCNNNQIASIDVSSNSSLIELYVSTNQLTSLDVSNNLALTSLLAHDNQFTSLDVSLNTSLNNFTCNTNQLTSLNVKNGNNSNFTQFFASNNPNLTCIEVDDAVYSTTNWTNIDVQTSFSEDCSAVPMTYVPDDNFEQALIDLGHDSGPLDDYVPTANINTLTSLNVSGKNISDLTGIEDFVALETLYCLNNQLTSLNVSNNTSLVDLRCYSNNLTSLDVTNNSALTLLHCYYNDLTSLDVSNNTLLEDLRCGYTQIETIDLSNNTQLKVLVIGHGAFTSLDVSNNPFLELLRCEYNQITSLNVDNNPALIDLYCGVNDISSLNLSNNINLSLLSCGGNDIEVLDLSNNTAFTSLSCQSNQLTSLNLKNGNNTNVISIATTNNPNLECIEVDDQNYSTANWTLIDSQTVFSEDCSALSINTFNHSNMTIYPNPATDFIAIDYPLDIEKVEFYNLLGQLVLLEQAPDIIDVGELSNGAYIMKIHTIKGIATKKLIKK